MDQYQEYIDWLTPVEDKKTEKDSSIEEKRRKYGEYFKERKKTFRDIIGRSKNKKSEGEQGS